MRFEVVFLLLFGLITCTLSAPREGLPLLNPGGIGGIFEGPNSETIIQGPDGSEITSEQKGGAVVRDDGLASQPIVVAEPQVSNAVPIIAEEHVVVSASPILSSTGGPVIASANPVLASPSPPLLTGETYEQYIETPVDTHNNIYDGKPIEIVQQDPHVIETEIIEAPDVEPDQSSDLEGPSGRIITKGSASIVSGPASTSITEPRRIIVAPPKIAIGTPVVASATIPLREASVAASLPTNTASTIGALSEEVSYGASSTLAPPLLSYSTTAVPLDYGYSTSVGPLVTGSNLGAIDSARIDLGANTIRQSIPVVEYSASNGVINGQALSNGGLTYSSTEAPILSSTISTITTDQFSASEGPAIPAGYLLPPAEPQYASGIVSSTISPNIQKIPRLDNSITVDGRVGDLSQNEIASYDTRQQFLSPPDLSQAEYIAPALARNGIDASQVNLAQVPLSQVTRLQDGAYQSGGYDTYNGNRYGRSSEKKTNK